MKRIQSKKHKLGTYEINKISLSCFDDIRFVLDDGIHTLAYFCKDLKNYFKKNRWVEGVYFSSIVNEVLRTTLNLLIFFTNIFFTKIF